MATYHTVKEILCPECGTPMGQVPFVPCEAHRLHEPEESIIEAQEIEFEHDLLAILYESSLWS